MAMKMKYGEEMKDEGDINWKETCIAHGKAELIPTYRAVLICKTTNLQTKPNGHKPVWVFTNLGDEELEYHMVSTFSPQLNHLIKLKKYLRKDLNENLFH